MKITEKVEIETVTDVMCDVCLCSTQVTSGALEFATLQAHWGYGTKHDGERYELHLCEDCFFLTIANLKQGRRIQNLFSDNDAAWPQKLSATPELSAKVFPYVIHRTQH